jgi:protocatechuate 3,4-dioxygenase beta subunit
MVGLVPNNPEANVDLFRRDQSDFDGTFTLAGVVPGTYTIVAVENAWGFEWLKAGVLARYVQHGQNVIIGEKMSGTLHLPDAVEVQER